MSWLSKLFGKKEEVKPVVPAAEPMAPAEPVAPEIPADEPEADVIVEEPAEEAAAEEMK